MPLSFNNSVDIVANSLAVIKGTRTIDVIEAIDNVTGTTYTQTIVNSLLDAKVDDTEMVNYATKADTFTKTEVNQKITDLVAGAPSALNTLKELSDALGADQNFSTTVTNTLALKLNTSDVTTSLALKANASDVTTSLAFKAPLASPTFTGTVGGLTKAMVNLTNVDNTSDLSKPVSTLTTAQLNLRAPLASPTFAGTVGGLTKAMVNLTNVDDTSDLSKPVSTLTTAQLNLKAPLATPTFTGTATAPILKT